MILRILSLIFVLVVISGNPLSHLIPPQQCAYQQSVYRTQPSSIPLILQQSTNNIPYTQPLITQNQLAPSYQENYEVFPVSDDMNQVVLKRFPTLQPILNPNYSTYSQNGFESQILNSPNYRTPNIVNNYIIVPPDCCQCNDMQTMKPRNNLSNEGINSKKERKPRRKSGNQNPDNIPKSIIEPFASTTKPIEGNNASTKLEENQGKTRKRKRNKKPKENIPRENGTEDKDSNKQEINKDENQRTRKRKNKISNTVKNDNLEVDNNQVGLGEKVNSNNQRKRKRKSKPKTNNNTALIEPLQPNDNNQNKDYLHFTPPQAEQNIENGYFENRTVHPCQINADTMGNIQNMQGISIPYKTISNQDRGHGVQNVAAQERIPDSYKRIDSPNTFEGKQIFQNPKTNAGKDMNTFPNIPPEMQNIMTYMKSNFNGQQFANSDIFANYPFNYDHLYQAPQTTDTTNEANKNKRRKRPRRPHNRKRKGDQNKTPQNQSETKIETTTTVVETIKTTTEIPVEANIESPAKLFEKSMAVPHNIYSHLEEQSEYKIPVNSEEKNTYENISNVNAHNDEIADFGKNEELPTAYENGLIYDYYPDFTDSAGFYANNKEYYLKHPAHHKYYNENNRKLDIDILNQERNRYGLYQNHKPNFNNNREPLTQMHMDPKSYEYIVHKESYEEGTTPHSIIEKYQSPKVEKIVFKAPPALEFPDFRTEKVNKDYTELETLEPYYNFNDNSKHDAYIDDIIEKSSIYSISKTPMYNTETKPYNHVEKPKTTDIETVFINSKVVKYGQPVQSKMETTTTSENIEDIKFNDKIGTTDGPTIVVAQSLGYPEESWYT